MVKLFVTESKLMPICLEIFDLTELFYLMISVEYFKITGPSQCHCFQRFGHGSHDCRYPQCVKCADCYPTSECLKTPEYIYITETATAITQRTSGVALIISTASAYQPNIITPKPQTKTRLYYFFVLLHYNQGLGVELTLVISPPSHHR